MMKATLQARIEKIDYFHGDNYKTYTFRFYDGDYQECYGYFELNKEYKLELNYIDLIIPIVLTDVGRLSYNSIQENQESRIIVKDIINEYEVNYCYIYGNREP